MISFVLRLIFAQTQLIEDTFANLETKAGTVKRLCERIWHRAHESKDNNKDLKVLVKEKLLESFAVAAPETR